MIRSSLICLNFQKRRVVEPIFLSRTINTMVKTPSNWQSSRKKCDLLRNSFPGSLPNSANLFLSVGFATSPKAAKERKSTCGVRTFLLGPYFENASSLTRPPKYSVFFLSQHHFLAYVCNGTIAPSPRSLSLQFGMFRLACNMHLPCLALVPVICTLREVLIV